MKSDEFHAVHAALPRQMAFTHFEDRDSLWMLACMMKGDRRVADLRDGPARRFLARPAVAPLVSGCGGVLPHLDVQALAQPDIWPDLDLLSRAGADALDQVYAQRWMDFELTFAEWEADYAWLGTQVSRAGSQLVVQLGFPSDHGKLMARYLPKDMRSKFQYDAHPVRLSGRPTLAWSRIDIDQQAGVALIEEVQSDWLRFAASELAEAARQQGRSRHYRGLQAYEAELRRLYGRLWPRAMMLASLIVLREKLQIGEVWMHQPWTGEILKGATGPRSLYSELPKRFGFEETRDAPEFLRRLRRRDLRKAGAGQRPVFWRLEI